MNTELLQRIKASILAEPDTFRMDTWSCGTAHCIAGWACVLAGQRVVNPEAFAVSQRLENGELPNEFAQKVLKLPGDGMNLFDVVCWPTEFEERYNEAQTRRERAAVAAERIDAYIAADGSDGESEDSDDWPDDDDDTW
jgi:hypothetical protein